MNWKVKSMRTSDERKSLTGSVIFKMFTVFQLSFVQLVLCAVYTPEWHWVLLSLGFCNELKNKVTQDLDTQYSVPWIAQTLKLKCNDFFEAWVLWRVLLNMWNHWAVKETDKLLSVIKFLILSDYLTFWQWDFLKNPLSFQRQH